MTDIESCREVCIRVPTRPKECGVTTAGGGRERERERPRQRQKEIMNGGFTWQHDLQSQGSIDYCHVV